MQSGADETSAQRKGRKKMKHKDTLNIRIKQTSKDSGRVYVISYGIAKKLLKEKDLEKVLKGEKIETSFNKFEVIP